MTCVNFGRRGHAASERRQPKRERAERPCSHCGKPGPEAKARKQPKVVHSVTSTAEQASGTKPPAVFAITTADRRPMAQQANLGDFIPETPAGKANSNSFSP